MTMQFAWSSGAHEPLVANAEVLPHDHLAVRPSRRQRASQKRCTEDCQFYTCLAWVVIVLNVAAASTGDEAVLATAAVLTFGIFVIGGLYWLHGSDGRPTPLTRPRAETT